MKRDKAKFDVLSRIDDERRKRGWSEYQLAVNSDITQSTISTWRKRELQPNIASIEKICAGFGITLSQFFQEDDSRNHDLNTEEVEILDMWHKLSPRQRKTLVAMINSFLEISN